MSQMMLIQVTSFHGPAERLVVEATAKCSFVAYARGPFTPILFSFHACPEENFVFQEKKREITRDYLSPGKMSSVQLRRSHRKRITGDFT
jgi:hypothetical protein